METAIKVKWSITAYITVVHSVLCNVTLHISYTLDSNAVGYVTLVDGSSTYISNVINNV